MAKNGKKIAKFVKKIKNGQIFFSMAKFSKFGHKMAKLATMNSTITLLKPVSDQPGPIIRVGRY